MGLAPFHGGWSFGRCTEAASTAIKAWPKIPRAWWHTIAEEYAVEVSGPRLAEKYGVVLLR